MPAQGHEDITCLIPSTQRQKSEVSLFRTLYACNRKLAYGSHSRQAFKEH